MTVRVRKFWDQYGTVVMSENVDYGGMFEGEQGVFFSEGKYRAFAKDGWGAGGYSKPYDNKDDAVAHIERLAKKIF